MNKFCLSNKIRRKDEIDFDDRSVIMFADVKEFIRKLKIDIGDVNKKLGLHNVDECECCEKNWQSIYKCLEIISELAGDKLDG